MLNEGRTERYYCKDERGRDLFFIEIVIDDELQWSYLNTSLNYDFSGFIHFNELEKKITDFKIDETDRQRLADELFTCIKSLPTVEQYFFKVEYLDKSGRHVQEYSTVIQQIIQHKDFPDYTVFSGNINAFYFEYSLPFLYQKLSEQTAKVIDKKYFEKLIENNINLSVEYVEWLAENCEYFHVFLYDQNTQYDCFIMKQKKDIKLFFVRHAILLHL
jgi:hypothetical protein